MIRRRRRKRLIDESDSDERYFGADPGPHHDLGIVHDRRLVVRVANQQVRSGFWRL